MKNSGEPIACTLYFNGEEVSDNTCHNVEVGDLPKAGATVDCDRERYSVEIRSSKGLKQIDTCISESGKKEVEFEATRSGRQCINIAVTEIGTCRTTYFKLIVNVEDCDEEEDHPDECHDYCYGDCSGERHRNR